MYTKKKILLLLSLLGGTMTTFAQGHPEMADVMRENGKIYVVVTVVVIIFLVLFTYLITMDMKVKKLERKLKDRKG